MDMRVSNAYSTYKIYSNSGSVRPNKAGFSADAVNRDAFTLSGQAEDYQNIRSALSQIPDVRQDQVNSIQARIESGHYNISATAIADKILQNV